MIPRHYRDAVSRAIQAVGCAACPVGDGLAIPGVGSFASTPITLERSLEGARSLQWCRGESKSAENVSSTCLFIPANPNATFGLPRTMLNPRQFQFAAKFTF